MVIPRGEKARYIRSREGYIRICKVLAFGKGVFISRKGEKHVSSLQEIFHIAYFEFCHSAHNYIKMKNRVHKRLFERRNLGFIDETYRFHSLVGLIRLHKFANTVFHNITPRAKPLSLIYQINIEKSIDCVIFHIITRKNPFT